MTICHQRVLIDVVAGAEKIKTTVRAKPSSRQVNMAQSDHERAVLYLLLHEPDCRDQIFGTLKVGHFLGGIDSHHGQFFSACRDLWQAKTPIDPVTIIDTLERENWNSSSIGDILEQGYGTPAALSTYLEALQHAYNRISLLELGSDLCHSLEGDTRPIIGDYVSTLKEWITAYEESISRKETTSIKEAVSSFLEMKEERYQSTTIQTGITDLDKWVKIARGDLVIVAGRPGAGKSTYAYNLIRSIANKSQPIFLVSLEVRPEFVAMPLIAIEGRLPLSRIELPASEMTDAELSKLTTHSASISELPIKITRDETIEGISTKIRREARINPDLVVVIDYIQLVTSTDRHGSREQEVAYISRTMKNLAHEINCPIIALAQLNRLAAGQTPKLHHLRESGAIEQDADTVILLHSEDDQEDDFLNTKPVETKIIIAKQRRGRTFAFTMIFHKSMARFDGFTTQESY